ncbi:MAG: SPASM domain-containing protein [Sphaerochaetaceae bacterium]
MQKNQISGFALKFTRLAQDAKLSFDSSMVTNGSLIDEGVIQTLKILNTRLLQVTIDGGKVQHDQTRCYMNGEPSFDLIIAKIIQVVRAMDKDGICFLIRFNLNSSSIDEVESSLNVIPSSLRRRIHVMFRPIFSTPLYHVNNKTTYDDLDGFNSVASEMGFLIYKNKRMFLSCEACGDKNFFHVLPDLSLWKCINDFSFQEARIGQMLKDGSIKWNVQRINNWFKNADFFNDEKCKGCSVAPDCLGGCIRQYAITKKRRCGSCKSLSSAYKYR